jgi:RimK family alpha-L-glutamate ligase
MNKQIKIAVFFGGKISQHLVLLRKAAKKLGVRLDLVSYNRVCFDTEELRVKIRGNLTLPEENKAIPTGRQVKNDGWLQINDYDVLFFRTTGKHWEEVDLIINQLKITNYELQKKPIIVDPIVLSGKPSMACKAYQMLALKKAGIEVPRTVYGSLWYLYEIMSGSRHNFCSAHTNVATLRLRTEKLVVSPPFNFPVIIKGSGGDRGTRVFKADNLEEMEKLVRDLRKSETEEGKRYMLQEYIPNNGDYRVLVLGKKVLGVMKRSAKQNCFLNNYSAGGTVEVAELPENIKQLAVKATEVCGLMVAGVDVAFRDNDLNRPVIWEVNKGPQFKGFMKATGIDVPAEIVKFLASLTTKLA